MRLVNNSVCGKRVLASAMVAISWHALVGMAFADVVSFSVTEESGSAQTSVPITFGQVFAVGDVPAANSVVVRQGGGAPLATQVVRKATHADGSLRHAIITAEIPAIAANATSNFSLELGTPSSGDDVALAAVLASGFDATIEAKFGSVVYSASARELLQGPGVTQWQQGPLVSEWVVGGALETPAGAEHPHLAGYFHVRAYQNLDRVRVDFVVENGWAFVPNPARFTYDATLKINANTVYTRTGVSQPHHTRWHQAFWQGDQPALSIAHDGTYLKQTKAVPYYADGLQPSNAAYSDLVQVYEPLDRANHRVTMGDPGYSPTIGPLPLWDALYIVASDKRAYNAVVTNASAGGSYSIHYREKADGSLPTIVEYPRSSVGIGNDYPAGSGGNPYSHDVAHQPSIGYLAYLLTGDYFFLEELQYWANYNFIKKNYLYRLEEQGIVAGRNGQVRGHAWSARTLGHVAYITPDDNPNKAYFVDRVELNLAYLESDYSDDPAANRLFVARSSDGHALFAPWMDDFLTYALGQLVDLGFTRAVEMRDWKAGFIAGRLGSSRPEEYCYNLAGSYRFVVGTSDDEADFWPDFKTLYEQNHSSSVHGIACGSQAMANWQTANLDTYTYQPGQVSGRSWSATGYYANAQPAAAIAVDAGVATEAQWNLFANGPVVPDYNDNPIWAIVPRVLNSTGQVAPNPPTDFRVVD